MIRGVIRGVIRDRDPAYEEVAAENGALRAENAVVGRQVLALKDANDVMTRKIAELEEKSGRNSQNSSMAPSSDTGGEYYKGGEPEQESPSCNGEEARQASPVPPGVHFRGTHKARLGSATCLATVHFARSQHRDRASESSSGVISTARALEPSDGPTTPLRSRRSISLPARAKPTFSLRCNIEVEPICELTTSSRAASSNSSSSGDVVPRDDCVCVPSTPSTY